MKTIITAILAMVLLAGCADHYPAYLTQAQKTDDSNKALVATYFGAQSARDAVVMSSMAKKEDPTSMILYSFLQGERDAKVIGAFKGSTIQRPKTGMDLWDTALSNTVPTLIRWGAGYMIAGDLLDALGAGMNVGGDYVSQTNSVDTGGGDFANSFDYTKTETTTTTNAGNDLMTDSGNTTDNSTTN